MKRLLLVFSLACATARADDWPQFRRDASRRGDQPGATFTFPLQRVTAVQLGAPIYASPCVVNGKVYVQNALGHVACIDAAKNKLLWMTPIGGFNNTSSPAVADGKVFVGSSAGCLFILDAATGNKLAEVPAEGGVLTAPAVANDAVYFSTFAGQLVKIDYSGNVLWSFKGGRISWNEFAVEGPDIVFFAGTNNINLYRLRDDGKSATVVSKTPSPSNCCPMGGPVIIAPDAFAFQSFDSEFGRFYLMKNDKLLIGNDISDSRVTPAVRDGRVYRGDKCFSVGGWKQVWRADPETLYDGGFHSSPALGKNVLAVGCERGLVHFFELDGTAKVRKPVWQYKTVRAGEPNSAVSSSPALVDGRVYFGGEDGILYGLGQGPEVSVADVPKKIELTRKLLDGAEWPTPGGDMGYSYVSTDREVAPPFRIDWKTRLWSVFKAPPVVAGSTVFCAGRLGNLTALDAGTGEILWKTHHAGVESRPAPTYAGGKLLLMRSRNNQGDSPYISGASGGPAGDGLWCHDAASGKTLWHQPMKFRYHFNHDGLAVDEGRVFVENIDAQGNVVGIAYSIDAGKELWRQPLEGLKPAMKSPLRLPPRFSGVMAAGLWCVSVSDRGTLALDPATGKIVWSDPELSITFRSRIAARDGVLVVFNNSGDHALDARTGKLLWKGVAESSRYTQALTDRYLKSQGREGVYPPAVCAWPIWANGHWYSHYSFTQSHGSNKVAGMKDVASKGMKLLGPEWVVWSYEFASNACPSPTPAYGRLYYAPAAEGVVYCFTPAAKQ